jgi:chromate reductase
MEARNVAVIIGSLRSGSFTRKVAKTLITQAPSSLNLSIVEIGDLPIYNPDLEEDTPPGWTSFRRNVRDADALLFVTPEYNRSIPGCLKNAIDVGSRPYGQGAWNGKPAGIVSVSRGALGAFGANHHLRQMLVFLDVAAMQQPEAYVGRAADLFDENDVMTVESTKDFLRDFMTAFAGWIDRVAPDA